MQNTKDLRIVYMGTPEFAVESLTILVENNYNIVGVITMPDKPAGRGHKIQYSAVKTYALEKGLNILQPTNLKDEHFIEELKALKADLQIVVAFRMLPEVVWNMPPLGTFNLHGSLLPQYRGAAPINWAIMNGEKETGVTTFFLQHEIDTGDIIFQEKIAIGENDNVGKIYDELMYLGAKLVLKTVEQIANNSIKTQKQSLHLTSEDSIKHAPKIFKETCQINWNKSPQEIHNHVRGLSPYPLAWSNIWLNNKEQSVKIAETAYKVEIHNHPIGTILVEDKKTLAVACNGGYIYIKQMQLPGKKMLNIVDILNGYHFDTDNKFL